MTLPAYFHCALPGPVARPGVCDAAGPHAPVRITRQCESWQHKREVSGLQGVGSTVKGSGFASPPAHETSAEAPG